MLRSDAKLREDVLKVVKHSVKTADPHPSVTRLNSVIPQIRKDSFSPQ